MGNNGLVYLISSFSNDKTNSISPSTIPRVVRFLKFYFLTKGFSTWHPPIINSELEVGISQYIETRLVTAGVVYTGSSSRGDILIAPKVRVKLAFVKVCRNGPDFHTVKNCFA